MFSNAFEYCDVNVSRNEVYLNTDLLNKPMGETFSVILLFNYFKVIKI